MRRLLGVLTLALVTAGAAGARSPRLEQLAPRPADMAAARNAVLRAADLGSGWTGGAQDPNDGSAPDCPFQDYSRFTITGHAQTRFARAGVAAVSRVELYESRRDAIGDFAVDTHPRTATCEGKAIRDGVARQAKGTTVTLTSARELPAPRIGERSVAFRIVLQLRRAKRSFALYIDLIGFVRGRTVASTTVIAPANPATVALRLARIIDVRLNRAA